MEKGIIQQFIEWIIHNGGLYFLLLVIFAETGLFIGFFLPGDSLLFAAGIYIEDLARELFNLHFGFVILLVIIASILGNLVGYWFGAKYGSKLFEKKDTFLFRKKHLIRAQHFYEEYGKPTIFLAKFLPIVRTFVPIIAGIVKMDRKVFGLYNILGSICWVISMMLGGHYLQKFIFDRFGYSLKDHIEGITIVIILVTTLPVLFKLFFGKRKTPVTGSDKDYIEEGTNNQK